MNLFHYTDKDGWNAVRSQTTWTFKASQPRDPTRPRGAYFTDLPPTEANLRTMHKRVRVPKLKQDFVFEFDATVGLLQWNGGHGRDRRIYYSPDDYSVEPSRQRYSGRTSDYREVPDDRRN